MGGSSLWHVLGNMLANRIEGVLERYLSLARSASVRSKQADDYRWRGLKREAKAANVALVRCPMRELT
jgi:hypothetical protein